MQFDVFFSICQTDVDGIRPSEREMFENFFSQVNLADKLGFGTAWVAETHLSCEVQKRNSHPVIPSFTGEIGLNTDILQVAHRIFARTERLQVGSAIRNILCNGGPLAHAEAIRTFLTLHGLKQTEKRRLELGFAAGRFEFSNRPYGIRPRTPLERAAWPVLKGKIFRTATEIFLRALRGDTFATTDIEPLAFGAEDFRKPEEWSNIQALSRDERSARLDHNTIYLPHFWEFEAVQVIPKEAPLELLRLTIGSHDSEVQKFANRFAPVGVFNLSITPADEIERTHQLMQTAYHERGGRWSRALMPRTVLVFINADPKLGPEAQRSTADAAAKKAIANYWRAMEGTLDNAKVEKAVHNALVGNPADILEQLRNRFHPEDRLMLWFDFNNHDNAAVSRSMQTFMEEVASKL